MNPPDPEAFTQALIFHHRAYTHEMEKIIGLMRQYKARCDELEMQLIQQSIRKKQLKDVHTQTLLGEETSFQRFDRRTFSESGIPMCTGIERISSSTIPDLWSWGEGLGNLSGVSGMNEGWTQSTITSGFSHSLIWEPSSLPQRSPTEDSQSASDSVDLLTESLSSNAPVPVFPCSTEEDSFDLRDIEEAIRESKAISDDHWETAGAAKDKKLQKPPAIPGNRIQQDARPKPAQRRAKACSEPCLPPKKITEDRKSSKNIVAQLPSVFLGRWMTVKSCAIGGSNDGRWKDAQKKDRRKEPRVWFRKGSQDGTYLVSHKKFTIKDALFYEHCGGQRCIVLKDRSNSILIRNKQHTYTFTIIDNQLLETFRDGGVEYRVLSAKE